MMDLPGWKAVPSILLPLVLLILSPTFRVSSDDYPLWLRGSPPPPTITYLPLNAKVEALKCTIRTEHQLMDRVTAFILIGLSELGWPCGVAPCCLRCTFRSAWLRWPL